MLVPILDLDEPELVLTRRAEHLPHHPGQVSFPGGAAEDDDVNGRRDAVAAIGRALAYKADWIRAKGLVSRAIGDARTSEFWKRLAQDGPDAGLLISELRCGGVAIGIEIGLRCAGRHVAHVGAFQGRGIIYTISGHRDNQIQFLHQLY